MHKSSASLIRRVFLLGWFTMVAGVETCVSVSHSNAWEPGDSLMVYATAVDSLGNGFDADSLQVVLSRNGAPFDTLGYGGTPSGMTRLAVGYRGPYFWPV